MSLIGNLLWIILGGGILIFLGYLIGGLLLCLTIVGIPFGVQCFKLSVLGICPFGAKIINKPSNTSVLPTMMNVLWILIGGIWIALTHVIFTGLTAMTVIGIPFAVQHMKLAALALTPFGRSIE